MLDSRLLITKRQKSGRDFCLPRLPWKRRVKGHRLRRRVFEKNRIFKIRNSVCHHDLHFWYFDFVHITFNIKHVTKTCKTKQNTFNMKHKNNNISGIIYYLRKNNQLLRLINTRTRLAKSIDQQNGKTGGRTSIYVGEVHEV